MIVYFRLDFRLLHFQTAQVWPPKFNVNEIVVANDRVAKDALQTSLMKMAKPKGSKLKILSMKDAITYLNSEESTPRRIQLLVETSKDALDIVKNVKGIGKLNVALMKGGAGKKLITPALAFAEDDYENLEKILDKGITVESFVTPDDRPVPIENYLKK